MSTNETLWMVIGACTEQPDLPWTSDPDQVGLGEEATMAVICEGCIVRDLCEEYAGTVTAGFWAGRHRMFDEPGSPGVGDAA
jgi:hypothetical protein